MLKILKYRVLTKILHCSGLKGLPISAATKSTLIWISELINEVFNPSFLRWGSIEWEKDFKSANPFFNIIVLLAICSALAYSSEEYSSKNLNQKYQASNKRKWLYAKTSSLDLFVNKSPQSPLRYY